MGHPAVDLAIVHSLFPPQGRDRFRRAYGEIDDEIWLLAKFPALVVNLNILMYAADIGDLQKHEAAKAIAWALEG